MKPTKTTTPLIRNSINRAPLRCGFLLIPLALALAVFAPSHTAQAADGGLPNFNTAEGDNALASLTSGNNNTALGSNALLSNNIGSGNTATGSGALANNNGGCCNTATGFNALFGNTTGTFNTANGIGALFSNTTGFDNTANGVSALGSNTTGRGNTANGVQALFGNTTGGNNTADGVDALQNNTTGGGNTANGVSALGSNMDGNNNTANGFDALLRNTGGVANTATGVGALQSNNANFNTANGVNTLISNTIGASNTADGFGALNSNSSGSANIALGALAGANLTTGSNNIDIGNIGVAGESNTIRIGTVGTQTATFIAGISGATIPGGVGVLIDANGHLGVKKSSARFKEAIKPMDKASEAILALQPVTFRYKHDLDPEGIPQFGLVAEQVEKVNPDLVARDSDGKVNTVRYEAVNAMLLNEFLKEHHTVQELKSVVAKQEATIAQQQKDFQATAAHQQKQIETLTAGLQKVSVQVELKQPSPRMAVNSQ